MMRPVLSRVRRDQRGAIAAEFALVLPLLLLFLFGIIDAGRLMWTWNQAEKATQMGARMAVVTNMVPNGLYTMDYAATLGQGVTVPTSSFSEASCTKTAGSVTCACAVGGNCPPLGTADSTAFDAIVTRMQYFLPALAEENVTIDYTNSGLGYAGDPNGADVAPVVTVRIVDMTFSPLSLMLFGVDFDMPEFRAGLTMEDGNGAASN